MATGVAPVLDAHATDGEQRRVTMMFADITGSTELVAHLDPEATANLLDPMIAAMTETAERYGGAVSPRGDGILAMFGATGASEDNAVRACLAALEILRHVGDSKPRVRIGIHHGEVALLTHRQGPARENFFGPAIHVAARLEQTAEPGSANLSAEAYDLVHDFVRAEPLPPVQAKGISQPLARFRLLGLRATSRWRARLERGLTSFINRKAEAAALADFLQRAVGPGAHLLQVLGQAGIGKSRLVHEALHTDAVQDCCVIALAGPIHRGHAGYDPLVQWLRDVARDSAGWNSDDEPSSLVEKLPGATLLSAEAKRQLVRYLGLGETTQTRVADFDAIAPVSIIAPIATIIEAMARGRRVLLACEDAETLDNRSLEHLAALSDAVAARGPIVMLVLSSRRTLKLPAKKFATRKTLRLPALEPEVARQLLARIHPDTRRRADLADTILAKADGNPLFLEEVSAMLLTRPAGRDADDGDASAIPNKIEALIADRLSHIPQQTQMLLRVCAVLGSSFSPELLPAVSGQSAAAVQEQLARLKAERLLHDAESRIGFSHLLVRDVAYRTLLPSRRRSIHEKVLRLLEHADVARRSGRSGASRRQRKAVARSAALPPAGSRRRGGTRRLCRSRGASAPRIEDRRTAAAGPHHAHRDGRDHGRPAIPARARPPSRRSRITCSIARRSWPRISNRRSAFRSWSSKSARSTRAAACGRRPRSPAAHGSRQERSAMSGCNFPPCTSSGRPASTPAASASGKRR